MALVRRVLPAQPIPDLAGHIERFQGGQALFAARQVEPAAVIDVVRASGLRGRGGAGFPPATKWRTVADNHTEVEPATVVVNAAEGEPGTFKDRAILRADPYAVLEGALIAAHAVGADTVVMATKATFTRELDQLERAVAEITEAGWAEGITIRLVEGPGEYLYGEETALLEVIDGRPPLPRIAPPYRRGVDEVVETVDDLGSRSGLSAHVEMAGSSPGNVAAPTLVNNVETLANIPEIVLHGADWFRQHGTAESPGTIVCTITGRVQHPATGEVAMGTTLREAIEEIGGGLTEGRTVSAVIPGVANAFLPPELLDTPLTYEAFAALGSGLGSAGFIVLDDTDDVVAAAAGVSRFLAVESCGQCTPCKQDGRAISEILDRVIASPATQHDLVMLADRTSTVADGARCNLARQQQAVVAGLLARWGDDVADHLSGATGATGRFLIAELVDIDERGAVVDSHHEDKQPDWTFDEEDSGVAPADRLSDHRVAPG